MAETTAVAVAIRTTKQLFFTKMTHKHYIIATTVAAALAQAGAAFAATIDFGEIERGKLYEFSQGDELKGTYTAPETGLYKFVYTGFEVPIFPDQNYTDPVEHTFFYGGDGSRNWMVPLNAGQKVFLYSSAISTIGSGTMMLANPPESLDLVNISPSLDPASSDYYGGELSASMHYRMTFFFSDQVTCTSASLRFPDGSYSPCATQIVGASIQVGFSAQIMEAYREGKLKKGDTAKIRLVGVKSVDYPEIRYGSNGRLEVEFNVADKPAELVSTVNCPTTGMEKFLSYYLPGDPSGMITLEFDKEIVNDPEHPAYASLTYGNPEDLEHQVYTEMLPLTIDGTKVTADATGRLRRPGDMIPGLMPEMAEKYISLRFGNLLTADGQLAFTGSMSSFSMFGYAYPVETVSYTYATDFVPGRGATVKKGDAMEIWIMNGSRLSFDNITMDYVKNGQPAQAVIGKESLQVAADPEDPEALLINFTMPDLGGDDGSQIDMTLGNVFFADGIDHTRDVKASYTWSAGMGVDSMETTQTARADVYTMTGVRVLTNVARADLSRLPKGIYLYGNRRIVVR